MRNFSLGIMPNFRVDYNPEERKNGEKNMPNVIKIHFANNVIKY